MTKKVLLIDMDNTIYNFSEELEKRMREDPILKKYEFPHYSQWSEFDPRKFLTKNEDERRFLKQKIRSIYRQEWFYASLQPYEWIGNKLQELSRYYKLFICSAPSIENYGCENEKKFTIERDFGLLKLHDWQELKKNTIFTRDKTMVKWDFLIDDKPTIEQWIYTPERKRIILDQPYNQHLTGPRIDWTMSAEEIKAVLEDIK